jgi:hypothetical protein
VTVVVVNVTPATVARTAPAVMPPRELAGGQEEQPTQDERANHVVNLRCGLVCFRMHLKMPPAC